MATLEQRLRALEKRGKVVPAGELQQELTDEELEGVIQMMKDRGEWEPGGSEWRLGVGMSDAELSAVLMPLVEEWRASHGHH